MKIRVRGLYPLINPTKMKVKIHSLWIDLNKSEEEIYNNLSKTIKRSLKKFNDLILIDTPESEDDIKEFYKIYLITAKNNFKPFSYEEFKNIKGKIFLAKLDKQIIAGIYNKISPNPNESLVSMKINASLPEFRKYQANSLLYWRSILWAKSKKFLKYDLGGFNPNVTENDRVYNINKFKLHFGGELREFYVDKNPLVLFIINTTNFPLIKELKQFLKLKIYNLYCNYYKWRYIK